MKTEEIIEKNKELYRNWRGLFCKYSVNSKLEILGIEHEKNTEEILKKLHKAQKAYERFNKKYRKILTKGSD